MIGIERVERNMFLLRKNEKRIEAIDSKHQFCTLVSEYKINMFRLAKTILRNDTDAEDAVAEAVCKAYASLHTLRNTGSFKSWIMRIVVNEAYTISNKRKKVIYYEDQQLADQTAEDNTNELWSVVQTLEDEFRVVTVLYYYEDMSINDISNMLSLPQGTVKSRLSRAREKLKKLLSEEGSN